MEDTNFTIAKITHEIRNPLTLINSSLQLIQSMHPEVKEFRFWSQTLEDVSYVTQLLDDLAARRVWQSYEAKAGISKSPQKCL